MLVWRFKPASDMVPMYFCNVAMAGNIIPAIATTNAVIAGLIVIEALKVLSNNMDKCKTVSPLIYQQTHICLFKGMSRGWYFGSFLIPSWRVVSLSTSSLLSFFLKTIFFPMLENFLIF